MKTSSVLKAVIAIFAVVFIGHQLISSLYNPIKTENAIFFTTVDDFKITGLILRNEKIVKSSDEGVKHFVISDGGRVSKDGIIANIYTNESDSITVTKIDELENKISNIEDILSYNDIEAANLDLINARINEKVNGLIYSASTGEFGEFQDKSDELLYAINRKQAAIGVAADLTPQLEALKSELTSLKAALPTPKGSIFAEQSGYFVSNTDGYEQVLTTNDLSSITPEFLKAAKPKENETDIIGKIVSDYEWYIAAEVSVNESLNYKEGEKLIINTSVKSSPKLSVEVKKINISSTAKTAVIIFSCSQMNSELASMRSGPMAVVKAEYSGLKIPRKALRVVDGKRGVYVLSGMQISFVPIEIVYSSNDYIICKKQNQNENVLKLYDSVVVKGKKLYDGKIIS